MSSLCPLNLIAVNPIAVPNSMSDPAVAQAAEKSSEEVTEHKVAPPQPQKPQVGLYTLRARDPVVNERRNQLMHDMGDICLHNAKVCEAVGQVGKQKTWELLARAIEGIEFDDWEKRGAFGSNLVGNLLRYYESLGDVQMLSSMVCVLRSSDFENGSSLSMLPPGHDSKYDTYIRRYADLLYAWGLLTIRAELNKHIRQKPFAAESASVDYTQEASEEGFRSTGLVFTCPTCAGESAGGMNVCNKCQDYVFRCSICDNAVRGLFTVCER